MNTSGLSAKILTVIKEVAETSSIRVYDTVMDSYVRGYSHSFLQCLLDEMGLTDEQIKIASNYLDDRREMERAAYVKHPSFY